MGDILLIEWMTNMFLPPILGTSVHIVEVTLKLHLCPLVNMPLIDVNWIGSFQGSCVLSFYFRLALEFAVG